MEQELHPEWSPRDEEAFENEVEEVVLNLRGGWPRRWPWLPARWSPETHHEFPPAWRARIRELVRALSLQKIPSGTVELTVGFAARETFGDEGAPPPAMQGQTG